jgi:hypothetical protein
MLDDDADHLLTDDDVDPAPRHGAELPARDPRLVRTIAESLDCLTNEDFCAFFKVKPSTAEAWRKRGQGPEYAIVGNATLYPKDGLRKYLQSQVRSRNTHARALL